MNDALNLGAELSRGKKVELPPVLANLSAIASSIQKDDPALFLWGRLPYITELARKRNQLYVPSNVNLPIEYINRHISMESSNFGATVFDLQNMFIGNPSFTDDGFHFSDEGNRHVASLLSEMIESKINK